MQMENNDTSLKLVSMVLFIAKKRPVNRTSLNKLLFFSDLVSYMKRTKTISEVKYFKYPYGPVPEKIDVIRDSLITLDLLKEEHYDVDLYRRYDYHTSDTFEIERLNKNLDRTDRSIIENVLSKLASKSASQLSELSHEFEPWKSADWYEELDWKKAKSDKKLKVWIKPIATNTPTLHKEA
jgi:Protein of unknown function (DUF4065)